MNATERKPLILMPGHGRRYECGPMTAVFKADGRETASRYSVSEWWLEPHSEGPGRHVHDENDELFFVIAGSPSILVGDTWHHTKPGAFLMIPAGTDHDFRNDGNERAGLLNVFIPGGFEENMPAIVDWLSRDRPPRSLAALIRMPHETTDCFHTIRASRTAGR